MPGKPKPTALKVFEGNRGKRPLPEKEPKPRPIMPKCPRWLSKRAKQIFKKEGPKFHRIGLLTEADGDQFGAMCQTMAYLEDVVKKLDEPDSEMVLSGKTNPLQVEFRLLANLFRSYAPEFGGTPRGRASLSVGVGKDKDGEDLLSR